MYVAIFALFLGTFCIGTTEFVITGLLPAVASDLQVTIPQAGLLVTAYAISVAIGGPVAVLALARLPRKYAALLLLSLFIVGHLLFAIATNFGVAMLGRMLTAVG